MKPSRLRVLAGDTPLGPVLLGASGAGISLLVFDAIIGEVAAMLPGVVLVESGKPDPEQQAWLAAVAGFLAEPQAALGLPIDLSHGSDFERLVWEALGAIPPGETASYGAIARRIGAPSAHRAVARACARNRIALLVPCHRVVRADGGLAGYRWGAARKQALLAAEARQRNRQGAGPRDGDPAAAQSQ